MATSDGIDNCVLHRGRSQSDPNILTESSIELAHSTDVSDQQRALHAGCLMTGVRTPPIRRNSKLATLGRIFKPWKWRKKKNDKLKQSSTEFALACGRGPLDPGTPPQGPSNGGERAELTLGPAANPSTIENLNSYEDHSHTGLFAVEDSQADVDYTRTAMEGEVAVDYTHTATENEATVDYTRSATEKEETPLPLFTTAPEDFHGNREGTKECGLGAVHGGSRSPPPPDLPVKLLLRLGDSEDGSKISPSSQPRSSCLPVETPGSVTLQGQISTPTGSPHLGGLHPPLPPSCIIEELHRALASKHRQDSFHGKEVRSSAKPLSEGQPSRSSSVEKEPGGEVVVKKDADENKENVQVEDSRVRDECGLQYDQDSWNDSVISGTLPRRMREELLAVKLRNRPSKQELEERNIFPVRSDQERQEIRQQIEMKLAKRLSQRPAVEELESRNILKQRNDQTEQEERREIKQRLNRKLNQRPTVNELRERKILIRFSDYVEVAKAQDYDRRADKPWTRLSAADKVGARTMAPFQGPVALGCLALRLCDELYSTKDSCPGEAL
ncbi:phosphatase and actin regulator 3a isoform X2 [Megalops cyprinoides]|uniref:phosphatase and actin regulator 3a isoform X2 n=1 Tax=Megalops cyprinoides TaxID=118141 RepID=UPI0018646361|nr:phosphatase and actin regulator 3a isoform X2 [Megalops cyprinoides]